MKKTHMVVGLLVFAVLLFTLHSMALGAQVVKIGIALPLTGPVAHDGNNVKNGALLALEHNKGRPELQKYNIEFVSEDDKSDPKDAAAIANKFAGDPGIYVVLGKYNSSCTLAVAPILTKAKIVQFSPGSSSPKITGFSPYLFRNQCTDELVGQNVVDWATELKFKKFAVVYENSDFGKGLEHVYQVNVPKKGGTILASESYMPGSTLDFSPIITKIKSAGAQAVLLGSLYNDAALIGKQAKQLRLTIPFFGDTSISTENLLDLARDAVEGWRCFNAMDPNSKDPLAAGFFKDYRTKYGEEPNLWAAQAYDAMLIFFAALEKYGPDREKMRTFLDTVKDFPGVTGKSTFKNGDVQKTIFRFIVKNGKFARVVK